jgi:hypothetical protein
MAIVPAKEPQSSRVQRLLADGDIDFLHVNDNIEIIGDEYGTGPDDN